MYLRNWHLDKFTYHKDKEIGNRHWEPKGLEMQAEPRSWRNFHNMYNGLQFILLKRTLGNDSILLVCVLENVFYLNRL